MTDMCGGCQSAPIKVKAHGLCQRCYMRNYQRKRRREGRPELAFWETAAPGHKICRRCRKELPREDFAPRKAGTDGRNSWCRSCQREAKRDRRAADPDAREKERAYEQRPDVQARIRGRNAAREYGIAPEDFDAMHARQGGRCAVCKRERKLAVDHCHGTGRVRELLCYPCNIALGQVNDDIDLLRKLIEYVERHRAG